jgi:hypothetical protein
MPHWLEELENHELLAKLEDAVGKRVVEALPRPECSFNSGRVKPQCLRAGAGP